MTMNTACFFACFFFLLIINGGAPVECRRHRERQQQKEMMLFVFGDSFVDAGGRPRTSERSVTSRTWFHPYGISDSIHGNRATGRASDGLVQSDFLAKILGSDESPLPYRLQAGSRGRVDRSGVNFAVGGSGVFDGEGTSLRSQIDQLVSMTNDDIIDKGNLKDSVALVAISAGHDYYGSITHVTNTYDMRARSEQVTDEIAAAVKRLQDLGVGKVLVNLVPPMGCNPWQSVANNYSSCVGHGNALASMHNSALREKLDKSNDVLLLDLFSVFSSLEMANLAPCCKNNDPNSGYCGQVDGNGRAMYSLCDNSEDFFFWDYMHPTQSAWEDIMEQLKGRIEDFLGIESSW